MSSILNNPVLLILAILSVLNFLLLIISFWLFFLYQKQQRELLGDEEGNRLDEIVLRHKKTLQTHTKNLKELGEIMAELIDKNQLNIQKTGLVRFNPFADAGGNMSFSLALLDGENNGIVISSLHSREGTRIYAKTIEDGESKYNLTDEEREAIAQANKKVKIKK